MSKQIVSKWARVLIVRDGPARITVRVPNVVVKDKGDPLVVKFTSWKTRDRVRITARGRTPIIVKPMDNGKFQSTAKAFPGAAHVGNDAASAFARMAKDVWL